MIWNFLKTLFPSALTKVVLFGRTDTGRIRPNNEDSFIVLPQANLMMVADGMGGHNAGEVASRAAIDAMVHLVGRGALQRAGSNQEEIRHRLIHDLRQTNEQIMMMACETPAYSGMGCTFIIGFVSRGCLYTCHVGDVRAYLLTSTGFRQLTNDHTYAAELTRIRNGSSDTAHASLPKKVTRNIVSRAIGFPFPEDPEFTATPVAQGDRILLCSDGLWSMLPDQQMALILQQAATAEAACDRLIVEANQAGGKDNVTAVVGLVG